MARYLVGAYTSDMGGRATGIVALESAADGSLVHAGHLATTDSPAYLAAHGDRVYSASEAAGTVEEFRRDARGRLEHLGSAPAGGVAPCHVARYGGTVVASCYVDGALGVVSADPLALMQSLAAEGSTAGYARPDRTPTELALACVDRLCHRADRAGLAGTGITLTLRPELGGKAVVLKRTLVAATAERDTWAAVADDLLAGEAVPRLAGLRVTLTGLLPLDRVLHTLF